MRAADSVNALTVLITLGGEMMDAETVPAISTSSERENIYW